MIDKRLVKQLYDLGNGYKRTGRIVGCSATSVRRIVQPEYAALSRAESRAAKRRRTGICRGCGGETRYGGKPGAAVSSLCADCAVRLTREKKRWTREAVIAAIQLWATETGVPPKANQWIRSSADGRFPCRTSVYRSKPRSTAPFATWSDAIKAAGLTPYGRSGVVSPKVLNALTPTPQRCCEIARAIGEPVNLTGSTLGYLGRRGLAENVGWGLWRLPA